MTEQKHTHQEKIAHTSWNDTPGNRQHYVVGNEEITSNSESKFRELVANAGYTHYIPPSGRKYKVKSKAFDKAGAQ